MTTLQKLAAINKRKNIYSIHFRNAGIGIQFYEPGDCDLKRVDGHHPGSCRDCHSWVSYLTVNRYHRTFVKAVDAEYRRLKNAPA